ncbi:MAG: hypothetical protein AAGH99_06500 [Planctomycetota bacterium]
MIKNQITRLFGRQGGLRCLAGLAFFCAATSMAWAEEPLPSHEALTPPLNIGRGMTVTWHHAALSRSVYSRRNSKRLNRLELQGELRVPANSGLLLIQPQVLYEVDDESSRPERHDPPSQWARHEPLRVLNNRSHLVDQAGETQVFPMHGFAWIGSQPRSLTRMRGLVTVLVALSPPKVIDLPLSPEGTYDGDPLEGTRISVKSTKGMEGRDRFRRFDFELRPLPPDDPENHFVRGGPAWVISAEALDAEGQRVGESRYVMGEIRDKTTVPSIGLVAQASLMFGLPPGASEPQTLRLTVVERYDLRALRFDDHALRHLIASLVTTPGITAETVHDEWPSE